MALYGINEDYDFQGIAYIRALDHIAGEMWSGASVQEKPQIHAREGQENSIPTYPRDSQDHHFLIPHYPSRPK